MSGRAHRGCTAAAVWSGLGFGIVLGLAGCATPLPERAAPWPRDARTLGLAAVAGPQAAPGGIRPSGLADPARPSGPSGQPAALPEARWWTAWGDPALVALIDRALAGHPSLALARARTERARALADAVQAGAGPQAGLAAELTHQRFSAHGLVPPAIAGQTRTSANLQAGVAWSPDLFGRQAAALAAATGEARAAQAEAALAATGLAGQIARHYLDLAHRLAQQDLAARHLAREARALDLTRQRVTAGLDDAQALHQAEAALAEARGRQLAIDEPIGLLRRQLAVLSGQAPEALATLAPRLEALRPPALPPAPGLDLLGRRAELVAARWRIEAAGADLALARSRFYPDVNLSAFIGLNALGLGQLLDLGSRQAGISPALRLPLFEAGQLRAQQGARQAELEAAVARYDGLLLEAVREAADALGLVRVVDEQIAAQAQALRAAEHRLALARQRQEAGLGGALPVLHAEAAWLAQRGAALALQARRLDSQLLLTQALGGGWQEDAPPAARPMRAETPGPLAATRHD